MKRGTLTAMLILAIGGSAIGQAKYLSNEGNIIFFSHTALEDITAENMEVASVLDSETGEVVVLVQMTAFEFEKKKMQEHFNENYVESETFPKATFRGKILNNADVDYATKGRYDIQLEGEMSIHGVAKQVSARGSLEVITGGLIARTKFLLNPEDYNIKIPKVVRKNISENMEIRVEINHKVI
ncbi:MAG: YceI family protein [Bacteroides sp.]|nr:YceI family protein [Bacteroides sp.]